MVVFEQKWLYSGKRCCIRKKVVVFWQNGLIRINWLISVKGGSLRGRRFYSGKMVVFGESGSLRAKLLYSGKSGCNWAKVVVFGQSSCIRAKVVVFG